MRQVVLDTETTGLSPAQGHRIIEIGCLEMIDRRVTGREFHSFLHPDREIDEAAQRVHGISLLDLETAPRFAEIADEFLEFIASAELIIHNAEFDVGFLEYELGLMGHAKPKITQHATVLDTLSLARKLHPGQRNSLDALCKRYEVDNSRRDLHGALLDAEILSQVYLAMTGGQVKLAFVGQGDQGHEAGRHPIRRLPADRPPLRVVRASEAELQAHRERLAAIDKASEGRCVWLHSPLAGA